MYTYQVIEELTDLARRVSYSKDIEPRFRGDIFQGLIDFINKVDKGTFEAGEE